MGQQGVFLAKEGGHCPGRDHWGLFLLREAGSTFTPSLTLIWAPLSYLPRLAQPRRSSSRPAGWLGWGRWG